MNTSTPWSARADLAQRSLDHFFGAPAPQLINNSYPEADNAVFNYWWLAHVIDARLDAFQRSGDQAWLEAAEATSRNLRERNGGSLFNDYFDDMLWYALALLRLHEAGGSAEYLESAREIWSHVVEFGWNDQQGLSVAWHKEQLHYKNTPANGPFAILSARLYAIDGDEERLRYGLAAFDWLTATLVGADGFVEDGINREGDSRVDLHWRFTYNQGLYVGAAVALSRVSDRDDLLTLATRTALTAIRELSDGAVFGDEGDGGDEGLFKGVYYRYLGTLLGELDPDSADAKILAGFVRSSTDELWEHGQRDEWLLAADDWRHALDTPVHYSTQLSAIMATELRAALESARE